MRLLGREYSSRLERFLSETNALGPKHPVSFESRPLDGANAMCHSYEDGRATVVVDPRKGFDERTIAHEVAHIKLTRSGYPVTIPWYGEDDPLSIRLAALICGLVEHRVVARELMDLGYEREHSLAEALEAWSDPGGDYPANLLNAFTIAEGILEESGHSSEWLNRTGPALYPQLFSSARPLASDVMSLNEQGLTPLKCREAMARVFWTVSEVVRQNEPSVILEDRIGITPVFTPADLPRPASRLIYSKQLFVTVRGVRHECYGLFDRRDRTSIYLNTIADPTVGKRLREAVQRLDQMTIRGLLECGLMVASVSSD